MSTGSWQAFADALELENQCLGELGAAALAMTRALVFGPAEEIEAVDRSVDSRRILHAQAHLCRKTMMGSGFAKLTLSQVCECSPARLRQALVTSLRELTTRGIALQITVRNNKALIIAGLARIAKTIVVMQRARGEHTGTYRRRGTLAPPSGSLILSRRA